MRPTTLIKSIARVSRALWGRIIIQYALIWGFFFSLASVALAILSKFFVIPALQWVVPDGIPDEAIFFALPILGLLLGALIGLFRRPSLRTTAIFLDNALGSEDRLATTLECLNRPRDNELETTLIRDTEQSRLAGLRPALAYRYFNPGLLLRFIIVCLVIAVLLILPSYTSARYKFHNLLEEESINLINTASDIEKNQDLDDFTREITSEMERLAGIIADKKLTKEQVLEYINRLSGRVKENLAQFNQAEEVMQNISIVLGRVPVEVKKDSNEVKQMLQVLEKGIRDGSIGVRAIDQLKAVLKDAADKMSSDRPLAHNLQKALKVLETGEGTISEPLERFFQTIANKNKEILERILTRLNATQREITKGPYGLKTPTHLPEVRRENNGFSLANPVSAGQPGLAYPVHPSDGGKPDPFSLPIPSLHREEPEKAAAIEKVIHTRERAFKKPFWPDEYDDIIREYFKSAE